MKLLVAFAACAFAPASGLDLFNVLGGNLRGQAATSRQPGLADDEDAGPEEAPTREEMMMAAGQHQTIVADSQASFRNPILPRHIAQPQLSQQSQQVQEGARRQYQQNHQQRQHQQEQYQQKLYQPQQYQQLQQQQEMPQHEMPQQEISQQVTPQVPQMQQVQQQYQQQPAQVAMPQPTMQEMVHQAEPAPMQMTAQQLQLMQQQLLQQQQMIQHQQQELQQQQHELRAPEETQQRQPPAQAAPMTVAMLPKQWPPAENAQASPQQAPTKALVAVGTRTVEGEAHGAGVGVAAGLAAGAASGSAAGGVMAGLSGMPAAKPKGWDQCLRFARFVKSQGVTGQELVRVWTGTCTPSVRSGLATQRYKLMCSSLAGVVEPFGAQLDYSIDKLCSDVLAVFHDVTAADAAAR